MRAQWRLMRSALLVIDVQQSFARRPTFSGDGVAAFLLAQNALIAGARQAGMPVVRVFHHESAADASEPFALSSGFVRPLEGLADFEADHTVHKTRHSALVGTGLDVWMVEQGIGRVIVSGIRTEQCCETTARHASDLGWQVSFVPEATLTWDIVGPDGTRLAAADLRRRTAAVLHGRFAQVQSVDEALAHGAG
jgi:nicotinamidase-related amidase